MNRDKRNRKRRILLAELEELEDYKRCHSLPSEQCEEMEQAWMELVGLQRNIEEIIAILDGKN